MYFDLFRHKIFLILRRGLLRRDLCATELRYNVGHP